MSNTNIQMYVNKGKIARFSKMCERTFFAVPFNDNPNYAEWAVFSNELAANMFASTMRTVVVREYKHVCIYR